MFRGLKKLEEYSAQQVPGAVMSNLVPQHNLKRRHIPINRDYFFAFLKDSGYEDVPAQVDYRADDELAARWYWDVFNFQRMNIHTFEDFRRRMQCFDFKIYTDGYAFSAQFTRPRYEDGVPLLPQHIEEIPGDVTFFVDPGKRDCFMAMQGLSFKPNLPTPIFKVSRAEYNTMAGINHAKRKRHLMMLRRPEVQVIDSRIPSKKTMNYLNYLRYVSYMDDHYETLTNYYGIRFNKLKFQTYVGSQMALSEVLYINQTTYLILYLFRLERCLVESRKSKK
jgi:hypothetical protein